METLLIEGATTLSRLLSFSGTFLIYLTSIIFSAVYLQAPLRWKWSCALVSGLAVVFAVGAAVAAVDVLTDQMRLRPFSGALGFAAILLLVGMTVATGWVQPLRAGLYFLCWLPAIAGGLLRLGLDAFPAELSASPLALNAVYPGLCVSTLLFAMLTSIEARRRALAANRALKASEKRFHDYSLTASDDFWETDESGTLTRASQRDGSAVALEVGRSLLAIFGARVIPNDRSALKALENALTARRPFRNIRIDLASRASEERNLLLNGLPILDDSGPNGGWRGTLTDITMDVTRERERGRERTMAALGVMVGSIAHEINNLLHPVINLSRLTMERMAVDDENRHRLGIVHDFGRRAGEIVADVLGLNSIALGNQADAVWARGRRGARHAKHAWRRAVANRSADRDL